MWSKVWNSRTEHPAYFDMALQHPPMGVPVADRHALRIGDRAAAYVYLQRWRARNRNRRLWILDDPHLPGNAETGWLSPWTMFRHIADGMTGTSYLGEPLPVPSDVEALNWTTLWHFWWRERFATEYIPPLPLLGNERYEAKRYRQTVGIEKPYVVLLPLWKVGYDDFRAAPREWWEALVDEIRRFAPVLVLTRDNPLQVTLRLITDAAVYVGGETGLTLWSAIQRTPTYALYVNPRFGGSDAHQGSQIDTRPFSIGAPVWMHSLKFTPTEVAEEFYECWKSCKDTGSDDGSETATAG